jgi:hypothetical protein
MRKAMANGEATYRVIVTDNIVCAIEPVGDRTGIEIPRTQLGVSTQLSANYQDNGRLDGVYYFADRKRARAFAILCLDFTKKLAEKLMERLEGDADGGELACTNAHHRHE